MNLVQFVIVCITHHDPVGKIVDVCDDEETAEKLREKIDQATPPSQLAFFFVKGFIIKE
jgi:hypothetical protein